MKRILSYLSIVLLSASVACSDSSEMDKAYNSVITPGFTFGEEEIIAGITPVTFTNTTTAEGTTVSEYFWHFGFAGEGNWSEEAAPDPIVYNRPGDYTVTLTAWGADGNRATTTRTITVLADNVLPTADFSYSPQMISIGTTVTFTDKSTDSDGEIVSREWLFPDGTTSTDINATYTFEQMGMFNVQLTVTDDRGGSNSTSKAINVRAGDVNAFTLLWSTAVASADALCAASVVAASDMGYIYSVSGDGKMVALNTDGAKVWEYDAMAKDGVYLKSEISYPSVDTDGTTLYIVADKATPSVVYALNTSNGSTRWSYTLDAASNSIPAVDNLGQIHLCTKTGDYVVLSAEGELRYKEHLADSVDGSPTISEWGYSYFLGKDSAAGALKVYSVALPGVTSPAASAWSQYGQNARHSNYQK